MALFAAGYAKRMMDGYYSKFAESEIGRPLTELELPRKYAVEAALNGLVAYLSTLRSPSGSSPVHEFLWELTKDAPSEISKRILKVNGAKGAEAASVRRDDAASTEQRAVIEGLLSMPREELGDVLTWIKSATPQEREVLAEALSGLTNEDREESTGPSAPERVTSSEPEPRAHSASGRRAGEAPTLKGASESILEGLSDRLRAVNDRIEATRRKP